MINYFRALCFVLIVSVTGSMFAMQQQQPLVYQASSIIYPGDVITAALDEEQPDLSEYSHVELYTVLAAFSMMNFNTLRGACLLHPFKPTATEILQLCSLVLGIYIGADGLCFQSVRNTITASFHMRLQNNDDICLRAQLVIAYELMKIVWSTIPLLAPSIPRNG